MFALAIKKILMKTTLKMLALVATIVGLASCGSNPAANLTGGQTTYLNPDIIVGPGTK